MEAEGIDSADGGERPDGTSSRDRPWHERDAFWESMDSVLFPEGLWERVPAEVDGLVQLVGPPEEADVLDLGCGTGRHALEFAARGYSVTGVDRTEAYLREARDRETARSLDIEWIRADMRDFRRCDGFDLAVSLYTSFGLFESSEENAAVLENLYASLRSGGTVAIEVIGKAFIAAEFNRRTWQEFEDGTLFLARREVEGPWKWLRNRWILVEPEGTRREFEMRHRLYSAVELSELLEESGFRGVRVYGGFDGRDYDRNSRRLLAVAEKP